MSEVIQWLLPISLVIIIVCEISIARSRRKTLKFLMDYCKGDIYVDILSGEMDVRPIGDGNAKKPKKKSADDKRKADARAYMAEYIKTHKLVADPETGKRHWVPREG